MVRCDEHNPKGGVSGWHKQDLENSNKFRSFHWHCFGKWYASTVERQMVKTNKSHCYGKIHNADTV